MSYRNDHDAALSRIDALEVELAEMARAHEANEQKPPRARATPKHWLRGAFLACSTSLLLFAVCHSVTNPTAEVNRVPVIAPVVAAPPAADEPTPEHARDVALMACVAELPHAIQLGDRSSASCVEALRAQASDPGLGRDIHDVLGRWLQIEDGLVYARSDELLARRDAMAPTIKDFIRAEYTR